MHATNTYLSESEKKKILTESNILKTVLAEMSNENIQLKNSISQLPENELSENALEELEDFYSGFIRHDTFIGLLRHDLTDIDKMIENSNDEENPKQKITKKLIAVKAEIKRAKAIFSNTKIDFSVFITKKISSNEKK